MPSAGRGHAVDAGASQLPPKALGSVDFSEAIRRSVGVLHAALHKILAAVHE
jgi:hypothetical protein